MARFDVHPALDGPGLVIDVQSDLIEILESRVVIPLLPRDGPFVPSQRLNPELTFDGARYSLATQYMSAVRRGLLRPAIGNLGNEADQITLAIDMLLQGF